MVYWKGYEDSLQAENRVSELSLKDLSELYIAIPAEEQEQLQKPHLNIKPKYAFIGAMYPFVNLYNSGTIPIQRPAVVGHSHKLSVFFTPSLSHVPLALLHVVRHIGVFPEAILLLHINFLKTPRASEGDRFSFHKGSDHNGPAWLYAATIRVGFAEERRLRIASFVEKLILPNIGNPNERYECVYYTSTRTLEIGSAHNRFSRTCLKIFRMLHHNAYPISKSFHLPPQSTVEIGSLIEL